MFRRKLLLTVAVLTTLFSWQPIYAKKHLSKKNHKKELPAQESQTKKQAAPQSESSINVIMDLGGVLVDTNEFSAFWAAGPLKFVAYVARLNNPREIRSLLFRFLETIEQHKDETPDARDDHGKVLPQIMCDWLAAKKSNTEIREMVCKAANADRTFFENDAQRQLVRALACVIFTPETMIKTRKLLKDGVNFVKKCKANGHKLYVLSNWDTESFKHLEAKYPELFELFDGTVISGECGYLKPDERMYHYLLEKYKLDPKRSVLIDDQQCNTYAAFITADIFGITCPSNDGWLHKGPDFKFVQHKFDSWLQSQSTTVIA